MSYSQRNIGGPRGLLRLYILHRISAKPMSGYDLISDLDAATAGAWHPGSGSVYPILEDMKKNGLIVIASKGKRSRQVYSVTRKGKEELEEGKKVINSFAGKWNRIRSAIIDLISAENLSAIVLETTRFNRVAWDTILKSRQLTEGEVELTLKEYRLLLQDELAWVERKLKSL